MTDPLSIAALLRRATATLGEAGIEAAGREARLLLQHVSAIPVSTQIGFGERQVSADIIAAFDAAVARRVGREPLSHITGHREFWSMQFQVTPDTLDPRADSETLVEAVLAELQREGVSFSAPLSLADFGTGTGCLLLALLQELPAAHGVGIDLNPGAVAVAAANAVALGFAERVTMRQGCWDDGLEGGFDIVISNPPYIPQGDIAGLQPEVAQFEPHLALDGGADGLDAYRALSGVVCRRLNPTGFAAFEIGAGQGPDVAGIMQAAGLLHVTSARDLQAHERVLMFRKS